MIAYANAIDDHDPDLALALRDWAITCETTAPGDGSRCQVCGNKRPEKKP